jgi:hypothetical protein
MTPCRHCQAERPDPPPELHLDQEADSGLCRRCWEAQCDQEQQERREANDRCNWTFAVILLLILIILAVLGAFPDPEVWDWQEVTP